MIDWNNFDAVEAERQAVEDGDAQTAALFGRIAYLERELAVANAPRDTPPVLRCKSCGQAGTTGGLSVFNPAWLWPV